MIPADGGQSTDIVEESDDVVDVEASGRRGVRGGDCTARSSNECRIAESNKCNIHRHIFLVKCTFLS